MGKKTSPCKRVFLQTIQIRIFKNTRVFAITFNKKIPQFLSAINGNCGKTEILFLLIINACLNLRLPAFLVYIKREVKKLFRYKYAIIKS